MTAQRSRRSCSEPRIWSWLSSFSVTSTSVGETAFDPCSAAEDVVAGWDAIRDGSLPNELDGEVIGMGFGRPLDFVPMLAHPWCDRSPVGVYRLDATPQRVGVVPRGPGLGADRGGEISEKKMRTRAGVRVGLSVASSSLDAKGAPGSSAKGPGPAASLCGWQPATPAKGQYENQEGPDDRGDRPHHRGKQEAAGAVVIVIAFVHDTWEFIRIVGPAFRWVHRLGHLADWYYS